MTKNIFPALFLFEYLCVKGLLRFHFSGSFQLKAKNT